MANLSEDIQCAGSDTRPPMLDKADFASWQQRIRLYCRGKENGVNILKSIDEGPFQMGTTRVIVAEGTEGSLNLGPERPRVYSDLSQDEKDRYNADIRATNIILQGLPKDIYSLINHYTDAKDIWDNVKMLLEGSELTKEDRESQLYDDFEHFRQNKGETIHDYYVRFAKLINDMRNIKMTMSKIQLNSKFVNNMLPEWGRFVTAVKLNKGLKDSNFDQLYAYLKQHEAHANENKMMLERLTQQTVDPLALMSYIDVQREHYTGWGAAEVMGEPQIQREWGVALNEEKFIDSCRPVDKTNAIDEDLMRHMDTDYVLWIITPTGLTEGERGFEQTKECYLTEVIPFFKTLKEHFEGIQKALTKEIKEMKNVFEELEAEVDQNVVDRKHDEITRKNLLLLHMIVNVDSLFKSILCCNNYSQLNVSSFTEMLDDHTFVEARCLSS
ncbi:hypothetical protein Tco_0688346 [Tanacetum coccineum]